MGNFKNQFEKLKNYVLKNVRQIFLYIPIPMLVTIFFIVQEVKGMKGESEEKDPKTKSGFNTELPFEKNSVSNKNKHQVHTEWEKDSMKNSNKELSPIPELNPKKDEAQKDSLELALEKMENFKFSEKKSSPAAPSENKSSSAKTDRRSSISNSSEKVNVRNSLSENERIMQEIERREKLRQKMNYEEVEESTADKISIKAYVFRDQDVLPGFNVNLTLVTPFVYKGKKYESGHPLYGTVEKVSNNKVFISVNSIDGLKLEAWDPRRNHEGLYFIQAGILEQELKEEIQNEGLDEVANQSQNTWIRTVTSILKSQNKRKFTYIPLSNDYEMILKN